MERVNVELKARDPDPDETAARCVALDAEDEGLLLQRDTYFFGRRGRLKLREQGGQSGELIAYRRPDAVEAAESTYLLADVGPGPAAVREALAASLGTIVLWPAP